MWKGQRPQLWCGVQQPAPSFWKGHLAEGKMLNDATTYFY